MIYVIGSYTDKFVKIGYSEDPEKRLREMQTGNPHELRIMACVAGDRAKESALHKRFESRHYRGEWFYRWHPRCVSHGYRVCDKPIDELVWLDEIGMASTKHARASRRTARRSSQIDPTSRDPRI